MVGVTTLQFVILTDNQNGLRNRLEEYLGQCVLRAEVFNTLHLLTDSENCTVRIRELTHPSPEDLKRLNL